MRAACMNRLEVSAALPAVRQGRILPEKPAGYAGLLKYTVKASVRVGLRIGPVSKPQRWLWMCASRIDRRQPSHP